MDRAAALQAFSRRRGPNTDFADHRRPEDRAYPIRARFVVVRNTRSSRHRRPGTLEAGAGRTVLLALALVALAELLQVWLSRLLEAHSWRVRLALDFALRQRVTRRLHQLPLSYHQRHTVGGTINRVNASINGF